MHKRLFIAVFTLALFIFSGHDNVTLGQCENCQTPQCALAQGNVPIGHNGGTYLPAAHVGEASWTPFIRDREATILSDWSNAFSCYRSWMVGHDSEGCRLYCASAQTGNPDFTNRCNNLINSIPRFWEDTVLKSFMVLTEHMSAVAMHASFSIGKFFDADQQLATQRLLHIKQFEAHKDYMPSKNVCAFGSAAQGMPFGNQNERASKLLFGKLHLKRALGEEGRAGASHPNGDIKARWNIFKAQYCDPKDNNWSSAEATDGLRLLCPAISSTPNADIDYTNTIELPHVFDGDFESLTSTYGNAILSLSYNLYGHQPLSSLVAGEEIETAAGQSKYFQLRSVEAKRGVARATFQSIVGLKAQIPGNNNFFQKIYGDLGESNLFVQNPPSSRFMMLETISKKLYQNPRFFADLYDKPANVARVSVSMKASELMLDRAMLESELRQEMALSVLLSSKQNEKVNRLNNLLGSTLTESVGGR